MKFFAFLFTLFLSATLFAQSPPKGIFISREEIMALPTTGKAWDAVKAAALKTWSTPDLSDQDDPTNVNVLAGAYYAVRTGDTAVRDKVRSAVARAPGTESGGRTLALGRELMAYIIAIDLVGWPTASQEADFKAWLSAVRRENLDGKTLISTHEIRPNNWGTAAGASRIAAALYLSDTADLARSARVFRGWLGDRSSYSGFSYGDLSWQCNSGAPVGINPFCAKSGHPIGGVLPDDQRRGGGFTWPPPCENYAWTGLEGAVLQAELLSRLPEYQTVYTWSDSALRRAVDWLYIQAKCPAVGNDTWMIWVINSNYGTTIPTVSPVQISRMIGWTDWTHGPGGGTTPPPPLRTFVGTWEFHEQPDHTWLVHQHDGGVDGFGATPNAALHDWLTKNPARP